MYFYCTSQTTHTLIPFWGLSHPMRLKWSTKFWGRRSGSTREVFLGWLRSLLRSGDLLSVQCTTTRCLKNNSTARTALQHSEAHAPLLFFATWSEGATMTKFLQGFFSSYRGRVTVGKGVSENVHRRIRDLCESICQYLVRRAGAEGLIYQVRGLRFRSFDWRLR